VIDLYVNICACIGRARRHLWSSRHTAHGRLSYSHIKIDLFITVFRVNPNPSVRCFVGVKLSSKKHNPNGLTRHESSSSIDGDFGAATHPGVGGGAHRRHASSDRC